MRSPEILIPFFGGCSFGSAIAGLFRRHCCEITRQSRTQNGHKSPEELPKTLNSLSRFSGVDPVHHGRTAPRC